MGNSEETKQDSAKETPSPLPFQPQRTLPSTLSVIALHPTQQDLCWYQGEVQCEVLPYESPIEAARRVLFEKEHLFLQQYLGTVQQGEEFYIVVFAEHYDDSTRHEDLQKDRLFLMDASPTPPSSRVWCPINELLPQELTQKISSHES